MDKLGVTIIHFNNINLTKQNDIVDMEIILRYKWFS